MTIQCEVVKKKSAKTGREYYAISVPLTNDYQKLVFLDKAEEALLRLQIND